MKYSDKFGEVIKVRLSSDDMPLLKDYVDNICDSDDMKSFLTAVLMTYLERYEHHKAQADEMNYYISYSMGFFIFVPHYLRKALSEIGEVVPNLGDFAEQFKA